MSKNILSRVERNTDFLDLSVEEQAEKINTAKRFRWKSDVPNYIKDQIDMGDPQEVRMWERIAMNQRYPFLRKDKTAEKENVRPFQIIYTGRNTKVMGDEATVYDIMEVDGVEYGYWLETENDAMYMVVGKGSNIWEVFEFIG